MSEPELTKTVIMPLLEAMGYERVEYYHGPDEAGKDLVAWRRDDFGSLELTAVQVKKLRPSRVAASTSSFSGIIAQLSQALEKPLPVADGSSWTPSSVYFITPYAIDTKTLASRFEKVQELRDRNVRVVDGVTLVDQVVQRLPRVARELSGSALSISSTLAPLLRNDILMRALDAREGRDVREYYTALYLAIEGGSSESFLEVEYDPEVYEDTALLDDWEAMQNAVAELSPSFDVRSFQSQIAAYRKAHDSARRRQKDLSARFAKVSANLESLDNKRSTLENRIGVQRDRIRAKDGSVRELERRLKNAQSRLGSLRLQRTLETQEDQRRSLTKAITQHESQISQLKKQIDIRFASSGLDRQLKALNDVRLKLRQSRDELRQIQLEMGRIGIQTRLDGKPLAQALTSRRDDLRAEIAALRPAARPSVDEIRQVMVATATAIRSASPVLRNKMLSNILGIEAEAADSLTPNRPRLELPIGRLFQSRLNFLLLGDAGAGKSTSLQNYAAEQLGTRTEEHLVIYAPLVRVVDDKPADYRVEAVNLGFLLSEGLSRYLGDLGCDISAPTLWKLFADEQSTLILDGIDEVIGTASWVPMALTDLATRFERLQVITSSRRLLSGLESIDFPAVSLLPFTDEQRREFLRRWFRDDLSEAEFIEAYLRDDPELSSIVRNPLLATILCVLREHGVSLPDKEVRLYEERMRLLVGEYDRYKGVPRRVSSNRYDLLLAARKLAFRLHVGKRREARRDEMIDWLKEGLPEGYAPDQYELLVDELTKPCEILLPAGVRGLLSFGHLRFQEYLAAEELIGNRALNPMEYVDDPWWRSVLVLFAQLGASIEWFVKPLVRPANSRVTNDTLLAMCDARPETERAKLRAEILRFVLRNPGDLRWST